MPPTFFRAQTRPDFDLFDQLVTRYREELNEDYCFQAFQKEQEEYARKDVYLFLATDADISCGCVGFWPTQSSSCVEMKRLYVLPDYRQHQIAQGLLDFSLTYLQQDTIALIELETLTRLHAARQLYRKQGFQDIPCTNDENRTDVIKMQKALKK